MEEKVELESDPVFVGRGERKEKGCNHTSRKILVLQNRGVWRGRFVERDE